MTNELIKHFDTLSECEQIEMIKKAAQELARLQKSKSRALKRELETSCYCSRAKRTTLVANSFKISNSFNKQVELLKSMLDKI